MTCPFAGELRARLARKPVLFQAFRGAKTAYFRRFPCYAAAMTPDNLKTSCQTVFERLGPEGAALFRDRFPGKGEPAPSHLCVRFKTGSVYRACVEAAREWGTLSVRPYRGREITWCRLNEAFAAGGMRLHWLELVEPGDEPHKTNEVTAIVYAVGELGRVEKIAAPGAEPVVFRYQKFSAERLAE
jgi:hypothetical protein